MTSVMAIAPTRAGHAVRPRAANPAKATQCTILSRPWAKSTPSGGGRSATTNPAHRAMTKQGASMWRGNEYMTTILDESDSNLHEEEYGSKRQARNIP